jgi:hypothetical protein
MTPTTSRALVSALFTAAFSSVVAADVPSSGATRMLISSLSSSSAASAKSCAVAPAASARA